MNPARDAVIIVIIIVALAVVFSVVRNAENKQTGILGNNFIPSYSTQSERQRSGENRGALTEIEEQKIIEDKITKVQTELTQIEEELIKIKKYGEASPYAGMVKIRKSSGTLRTTNVDREYIQLDASSKNLSNVVITNWKLQSMVTGRSVSIPKAVHIIFTGSFGDKLPITLKPGDRAYIITGRSPIGSSFLVNKCTGYYTQFQTFIPSIRKKCPLPEDEILYYTRDESIFIDDACIDFVDRMRVCSIPTKALPVTLSYTCQEAIINEINYASCVDKHKNDIDFRISDWRIYLRRNTALWKDERELIKLLDENGKTVDYYSY